MYNLISKHEDCFHCESSVAEVEKVFEWWTKKVHDKYIVVLLLSIPPDAVGHTKQQQQHQSIAHLNEVSHTTHSAKKVKVAHTRLPSVGFRSWSQFLAVSLQVVWVINPAVGCHYFPPGLQLPPQPLRGLLPVLLLGEQRHDGCQQFALDCYPTASRLRFEPGLFCAWVQHANHLATEPPS